MTKETCERILTTFEEGCRGLGYQDFEDGIGAVHDAMERMSEFLEMAGSRNKLEAVLMAEPEPDRASLATITLFLKTFPFVLRKALPQLAKELPHDPGGRPRVLSPMESQQVCEKIGALLGRGVQLEDAQRRVAQQQGVGLRTIQRAWQNRKDCT